MAEVGKGTKKETISLIRFVQHQYHTIAYSTCGTNTFKYRQSSLPKICFDIIGYCMHMLPSENAFNSPDQPGCSTGG